MTKPFPEPGPTFSFSLKELVTFRLVRLNAKLSAQSTRILRESANLTPAQWRVMFIIHDHGQMSAAQIVRLIGMDKGQLSRTIRSMTERGMLKSVPSDGDNRTFDLRLTDAGRAVFEQAQPHMRKRQSKLMGALSEEERRTLFAMFDKLEAASRDLDRDA